MIEPMEDGPPPETEPRRLLSPIVKPSSMVMMTITLEDYELDYWPKLEYAINQLLTTKPGEFIPVSYEQVYSCVYKCVCKQFSERLYTDLMRYITCYLEKIGQELQQCSSTDAVTYINRFGSALSQYLKAVQGIVPVFNYMNRFYVETRLKTNLAVELNKLFVLFVADRHVPGLVQIMEEVSKRPFAVSPGVMHDLVRNLVIIKPDYAQIRPHLFSMYIPNVLPPCSVSDIDHYIQEAQQMQRDYLAHPDFFSGDQSRKRPNEEEPLREYNFIRSLVQLFTSSSPRYSPKDYTS